MVFREEVTCVAQDDKKNAYFCTSNGCVKIFRHHQFPSDSLPTTELLESSTPWLVVHPDERPNFAVSRISVSFSGRCALLSGEVENDELEDEDQDEAEVGFRFGVLVLANPKVTSGEDGTRCEGRFFHYASPRVGRGKPSIKKIEWCRGSDTHMCMLTSNNHFLMYEVREDRAAGGPERDFHLLVGSGESICGLTGNDVWAEDFEFGPATLWGVFSVFFVCSDGGIYMLCPIAPRGTLVSKSIRRQLTESLHLFDLSGGQVTEFIDGLQAVGSGAIVVQDKKTVEGLGGKSQRTLGIDLEIEDSDEEFVEMDRNSCPALQGPLNDVSECCGFSSSDDGSPSISCCTDQSGLVIIATASPRGEVCFYVLFSEVLPLWSSVQSKLGKYTCQLKAPSDSLHLLDTCILCESGVDDNFRIAEVPDMEGCFLCWGQETKTFRLDVPSLKNLSSGNLNEAAPVIREIQPPETSPVESSVGMLGLVWMAGGTLLVWGTARGFEVTEFSGVDSEQEQEVSGDNQPECSIQSTGMDGQVSGENERMSQSNVVGTEVYGRVLPDGEAEWTASQLDALDPFLEAHLATVKEGAKQVEAFGSYVKTEVNACQVLVKGCQDMFRNLEEVWNVVDAWPSQGSCDEMRKVLPIDMQSLRVMEGLCGACELEHEMESEEKEVLNGLRRFKRLDMQSILAGMDANRIALVKVKEQLKEMNMT
ncbi:hypothetical protein BSKO_01017 [Bryopsis sp. KO-2023]|nr:hypothetical protein BSKO_01017 [Bryopsis sp. KO-2023]